VFVVWWGWHATTRKGFLNTIKNPVCSTRFYDEALLMHLYPVVKTYRSHNSSKPYRLTYL